MHKNLIRLFGVGILLLLTAAPAFSGPRRNLPGFNTNTLPANDDGSTGAVPIGFTVNLFGTSFSTLFVNNNGNVTFDEALGTYTPFGLTAGGVPKILAPFFADVDTRGAGSGLVKYGNDTVNGHNAFGVEWGNVGYYSAQTNKLNSFELVMIDRSDVSPGAFDFEFNYDTITWETGGASGGTNGLGGTSAHAGYSNGLSGAANVSYEFPGSGVNGALLDTGVNALINHTNIALNGRYLFSTRGGNISSEPTATPLGAPAATTPVLILSGLMLIWIVVYLKKRRTV